MRNSQVAKWCLGLVACVGGILGVSAIVSAYSFTQNTCPSGNECITRNNYASTDSTNYNNTSIVGWNIATDDFGHFNLFNFSYGNGGSTDNDSHDSRNRNSTSVRTACFYSLANRAGNSSSDPHSSTVYWRNIGIGNDVASSFRLVPSGSSC